MGEQLYFGPVTIDISRMTSEILDKSGLSKVFQVMLIDNSAYDILEAFLHAIKVEAGNYESKAEDCNLAKNALRNLNIAKDLRELEQRLRFVIENNVIKEVKI